MLDYEVEVSLTVWRTTSEGSSRRDLEIPGSVKLTARSAAGAAREAARRVPAHVANVLDDGQSEMAEKVNVRY